MFPDLSRLAVLCDSVVGGAHSELPAIRRLIADCPDVQLLSFETSGMTVGAARERFLPDVVAFQPSLVIVALGGADATLKRRAGAWMRLGGWVNDNVSSASRIRQTLRVASRLIQPGAPVSTSIELTRDYSALVSALLNSTTADLLLIDNCGGDRSYFRVSDDVLDGLTQVIQDIVAHHASRVRGIFPSTSLQQWEDYRSDRAHLSTAGHERLAILMREALQ